MQHSLLKDLKNGSRVDCVYHINFKFTDVNSVFTSKNGNKFIVLKVEDKSLLNYDKRASVFLFFNNESEIDFLKEDYVGRTSYVKVTGVCFSCYPDEIKISAESVIPATDANGIVFDTSNIYGYNDYFKNEFLSFSGKKNVALRNTSSKAFQEDYDLIEIGSKLKYKRIYNSPHDKYQINVFIDDIDDVFNIPAYLTPTMGKMIDDGYSFEIVVAAVPGRDDEKGFNAGIRVDIKGAKQ